MTHSLKTTLAATAAALLALCLLGTAYAADKTPAPVVAPMPGNLVAAAPMSLDPGAGVVTSRSRWANVDGKTVLVHKQEGFHSGYFMPDGVGGYIWVTTATPMAPPQAVHDEARELKLKVRELADQLFNGAGDLLRGMVALPTNFVNQDNFDETSSLGRYMAEQMFYECNQRGLPVREYRADISLTMRENTGEFLLTRKYGSLDVANPYTVVLVGTYYADRDNLFLNARLLRGADGMVLRSAMLVMPQTLVTKRMVAAGRQLLESTFVGLKDFKTMTKDADITNIDLGEDLH
ncbi:MAG: FlgO family outer membrane protein [Desulfovibrionaceae bacterium]